ncbi:MAG: hypothetical protein ACHQRM_05450 [Bacteroidia bacterium]
MNASFIRRLGTIGRVTFLAGPEFDRLHYKGVVKGFTQWQRDPNGSTTQRTVPDVWAYSFSERIWSLPLIVSIRLGKPRRNYYGVELGLTGSAIINETYTGYLWYANQPYAASFARFGFVYLAHLNGKGNLESIWIEPEINFMLSLSPINQRFCSAGIKFGWGFQPGRKKEPDYVE